MVRDSITDATTTAAVFDGGRAAMGVTDSSRSGGWPHDHRMGVRYIKRKRCDGYIYNIHVIVYNILVLNIYVYIYTNTYIYTR